MKKIGFLVVLMLTGFSVIHTNAQSWINLGPTYSNPSPYPYNYFLLMDMNGFNGNISAEFEVLVLADRNYMYHSRNSIFVSRHSSTAPNRLDGVSMNYISGKPGMLEVLVKNNQIWMRAMAKWGSIKYRVIDQIGHGSWTTPLTIQTTPPTNIVASSTQPFYYDFDALKMNHFPSLLPNGNMGIGTNAPLVPLEIRQAEDPNSDQALVISEPNNSQKIYLHLADNTSGEYGFFRLGDNTMFRGNGQPSSIAGSLSIGTTIHDGYKLAVKGKIRAEEIKVETGWADYVFKEGYDLPTLEEVEKHIKEKGHLINIPSAKEVEKNGIQLGEMNKLLLEKIEELTLYTLQQQRELKNQKEINQKLEERLNQLEKHLEQK
ncbi:hypothetical protein [Flagellimonas sp. 2504JD1-5]